MLGLITRGGHSPSSGGAGIKLGALTVQGPALTVQGLALTVQGLVLTVQGLVLTVQGLVLTVQGPALTVQGLVLTVQGLALTVQGPVLALLVPTVHGPKAYLRPLQGTPEAPSCCIPCRCQPASRCRRACPVCTEVQGQALKQPLARKNTAHCQCPRSYSCTQALGPSLACIKHWLKHCFKALASNNLRWCLRAHTSQIQAPVIDLEVRGVPALTYFGNIVWPEVYDSMNAGESRSRGSGWRVRGAGSRVPELLCWQAHHAPSGSHVLSGLHKAPPTNCCHRFQGLGPSLVSPAPPPFRPPGGACTPLVSPTCLVFCLLQGRTASSSCWAARAAWARRAAQLPWPSSLPTTASPR